MYRYDASPLTRTEAGLLAFNALHGIELMPLTAADEWQPSFAVSLVAQGCDA